MAQTGKRLSLFDVSQMASDLLAGKISRDAADRWAWARMQEWERSEEEFAPVAEHEKVWRGLNILFGCDLPVAPGEYLHSDDNLRELFENAGMKSRQQ